MDRIEERAVRAITEKVFPGCVIAISRAGERDIRAFGAVRFDHESVSEETIYDLASVTKSIPTAALAALSIEEKVIGLNDPVHKFLPEFQNDFGATIEDLLRYRVRGVALSRLSVTTFEEIRTIALEHGFDGPPGAYAYTNLPAFFLGMILEAVNGASLARLAHERLFEPLAMRDTTFFPAASGCAPTEIDARGEVRGLPHDESAYLFAQKRRTVGHAGLFSTASDLLTFCEAKLFEQTAIQRTARSGLGWQINEPYFMGTQAARFFGKTGFTGTSLVVDPERKIALVILSNRTYPKRPPDAASPDCAINVFRRDIADSILETS